MAPNRHFVWCAIGDLPNGVLISHFTGSPVWKSMNYLVSQKMKNQSIAIF